MDIFIAMKGSDVVSKILDFGDIFFKKMIKQKNFCICIYMCICISLKIY